MKIGFLFYITVMRIECHENNPKKYFKKLKLYQNLLNLYHIQYDNVMKYLGYLLHLLNTASNCLKMLLIQTWINNPNAFI